MEHDEIESDDIIELPGPQRLKITVGDRHGLKEFLNGCISKLYTPHELWGRLIQGNLGAITINKYGRVTWLALTSAHLIQVGDLSHLTELEALNLSDNSLSDIKLPYELSNLKSLKLKANEFAEIDLNNISDQLDYLDISNNQLVQFSLPYNLRKLESLILHNNKLTSLHIPPELQELDLVDLSTNELVYFNLPPTLSRLRRLYLYYNNLTTFSLPRECTALEVLDVSNNKLETISIPSGLDRVENIDLSYNELTRFNCPTETQGLRYLRLGNNKLYDIDISPEQRSRLHLLDLRDNIHLEDSK